MIQPSSFILLLAAKLAQAQTQVFSQPFQTSASASTPSSDTCFLQDSNYAPCPSYLNYKFPANFNNGIFNNPHDLSLYINSTLNNYMDLKNMRDIFKCSSLTYNNVNNLRYRKTQLCLYILTSEQAIKCNNNLQPPPMCKSDCVGSYKYFRDSISPQTVSNQLKCNYSEFSLAVDRMELTCNNSPLNGTSADNGQCIKANDNEPDTCGFLDINLSCNYCDSEVKSDTCCSKSLKQKCSLLKLQKNPTTQDRLLSNDDNNNKSMGYFIAGITCLVLSILLILGLVIYNIVVRKFKEQSQRSSFIDQSKPMLEGSSSQFTRLDIRSNTNTSNSTSPLEHSGTVFNSAPTTPHNLVSSKDPGIMQSNTTPGNNNTWGQTLMDPVDEDGSDLYRVAYPYQAVLEDELSLKFNQVIYLITSFDDGWGLGRNVLTGVQGAFPMACVTKLTDETESNHGTIVVGEDINQIGSQNLNFKTIQRRTSSQKINLKYSKSTAANTRPMETIGFA